MRQFLAELIRDLDRHGVADVRLYNQFKWRKVEDVNWASQRQSETD